MMLQTYYRQNHYKQTDSLRGSLALALEIPFFITAYQFISGLGILNGVSFGFIRNLAKPDALLVLGSLTINLLPLLMTALNIISTALFTRNAPKKTKIQLYAMAAFFLVFLYGSPSALLIYWTANNAISLLKSIVAYLLEKRAEKGHVQEAKRVAQEQSVTDQEATLARSRRLFFAAATFLTLLIGVLIPTTFIAASPQEYINIYQYANPALFVVSSFCLALGSFLVWLPLFYRLTARRFQPYLTYTLAIASLLSLINYLFFGRDLGLISPNLQYEEGVHFATRSLIGNALVLLLAAAIFFVITKYQAKRVVAVLLFASVTMGAMSFLHLLTIQRSIAELDLDALKDKGAVKLDEPQFTLSKNGQNVVVLMFDRAAGSMLPYIMNERPELQEKFAGFTYYPNTLSYGNSTNFAVPPLLGGYEYTPVEMNRRGQERLVDKHNEALLLMPAIFSQNDFKITICDPPYANYHWIPDLSIYDDYPAVDAYITKGRFTDQGRAEAKIEQNHRNFFFLSIMKTMPLFLQEGLYDEGSYRQVSGYGDYVDYEKQSVYSLSSASGYRSAFIDSFDAVRNLSTMTKITTEKQNTFLFFLNDITHEPMLLQTPDYVPSPKVDNSQYDEANKARFTDPSSGRRLRTDNINQMAHYHTNMAMMLQLANWFDELRAQGVYDNTRIIIASDHGRDLGQVEEMLSKGLDGELIDYSAYNPLLLVKDFGSTGFHSSDRFMTNADVPLLAFNELIANPVNPFTGLAINDAPKYAHEQYVILSEIYSTSKNNGNRFLPSYWASVKEDIWSTSNWTLFPDEFVLDQHAIDR